LSKFVRKIEETIINKKLRCEQLVSSHLEKDEDILFFWMNAIAVDFVPKAKLIFGQKYTGIDTTIADRISLFF
jgi:hypothetical protein